MKRYSIKVNGSEYEVEVEELKGGAAAAAAQPKFSPAAQAAPPVSAAPAKSVPAEPKPERVAEPVAQSGASAPPKGATLMEAPMPGTILKIHVSGDAQVKKGEALLVLEAMKMENDILAPSEGKVASVNVSQGDSVNAGDLMLSLV